MSEIRLINKELGEIKIDDKGYFAIPDDIYNAIEQLQQENEKLKKNLFSPDQVEFSCPKCGEKYSINYSREIYDLKQENINLKEKLEENTKVYLHTSKYASKMEDKYIKSNYILTEFEKWLENELFNKTQIHFQYSLALRKCLDKLQELKEGNI